MYWPKFIEEFRNVGIWLEANGYANPGPSTMAILSAVVSGSDNVAAIMESAQLDIKADEIPEHIFQTVSRWQCCLGGDATILGEIHQRTSRGRRAQGLYYTPSEVVDFILQQTVVRHDVVENPYVKILDPACGCGYFLLRAYDALWAKYQHARSALEQSYPECDWSDDGIHLHITRNNLWGADIDPVAVDITRTGLQLKRPQVKEIRTNVLVCDSLKSLAELNTLSESKQFWSGTYEFVIGNPPYLSFGLRGTRHIDREYADYLRQVFKETAEYKISYYVLFMQRGLELLAKDGKLGFIVPDSFLIGRYFSKIRRYILDNAAIDTVAHIATPVFKNATVGMSAVCIFTKEPDIDKRIKQTVRIYRAHSASSLGQETPVCQLEQNYYASTPHNRFRLFFDLTAKTLIDKIEATSLPLRRFAAGHTGIRSLSRQSDIIDDKCSGSNWQPGLISGRQITRFGLDYQGHWLNIDVSKLHKGGWKSDVVSQRKILLRQTGYSLTAALDENGYYHLNNLHSFTLCENSVNLDYLLMLLNSSLMSFYYHITSMEYGRAMAQTDIETIELLPVRIRQELCHQAAGLVKTMTELCRRGQNGDKEAQRRAKAIDDYFNQLIYRVYELTEHEISYIEDYERTHPSYRQSD
jgi:predicted RNA methylase